MSEETSENNKLILVQNNGLAKAEKSIAFTNKIFINRIEELFNEALYLMNR
ncbi:MAG: hypothetical protein ACXWEY_15990 [Bacteroidia bacterium]